MAAAPVDPHNPLQGLFAGGLPFASKMPPLEQLARLANPIPEPFHDRQVSTILIADLMAKVSGWDVLRLMFKPSKMIRYGSVISFLRDLPEIRAATEGPAHKNARKLAKAAVAQAPIYFKGGGGMASAENDLRVLRWSITSELEPLWELMALATRAGDAEHEGLRLTCAGQPASDLAKKSDPVVFSALWVSNNLRQHCRRFDQEWAKIVGTLYVKDEKLPK